MTDDPAADTTDRARLGREVGARLRRPGPPLGKPLPSRIGSLASSVQRFAAGVSRPVDVRRALRGPDEPGGANVRPPRWWVPAPRASEPPAWLPPPGSASTARLPARGLPTVVRSVPQEDTYAPGSMLASLTSAEVRVKRHAEVAASGPMLTQQDRQKLTAGIQRRTARDAGGPPPRPDTSAGPAPRGDVIRRTASAVPGAPAAPVVEPRAPAAPVAEPRASASGSRTPTTPAAEPQAPATPALEPRAPASGSRPPTAAGRGPHDGSGAAGNTPALVAAPAAVPPWQLAAPPTRFAETLRRGSASSIRRTTAAGLGRSVDSGGPVRAASVGLLGRAPALPDAAGPVRAASLGLLGRHRALPETSDPVRAASVGAVGRTVPARAAGPDAPTLRRSVAPGPAPASSDRPAGTRPVVRSDGDTGPGAADIGDTATSVEPSSATPALRRSTRSAPRPPQPGASSAAREPAPSPATGDPESGAAGPGDTDPPPAPERAAASAGHRPATPADRATPAGGSPGVPEARTAATAAVPDLPGTGDRSVTEPPAGTWAPARLALAFGSTLRRAWSPPGAIRPAGDVRAGGVAPRPAAPVVAPGRMPTEAHPEPGTRARRAAAGTPPPRTDGLAPRTDGLAPRTDGLAPRTDGPAPRTDGPAARGGAAGPRRRAFGSPRPGGATAAPASPIAGAALPSISPVAMPDQLVVRRRAAHGRRDNALASGFAPDLPIRASTTSAGTPVGAPANGFATVPTYRRSSGDTPLSGPSTVRRSPASGPPAAAGSAAMPHRPVRRPAPPYGIGGGSWAPAPGGPPVSASGVRGSGHVPVPAEPTGAASTSLLRRLTVAPPRTGPTARPARSAPAAEALPGTPAPATPAASSPATAPGPGAEALRRGPGSLIDRTAHLFADDVVRRAPGTGGPTMSQVPAVPEPAGDRLPATPLRGPAAPADPWSGGLPDPWRVDAAQSEPAREVIDRIVDAVVERIEERVLDELERRGRHDWRVV